MLIFKEILIRSNFSGFKVIQLFWLCRIVYRNGWCAECAKCAKCAKCAQYAKYAKRAKCAKCAKRAKCAKYTKCAINTDHHIRQIKCCLKEVNLNVVRRSIVSVNKGVLRCAEWGPLPVVH